MLAEHVDDLGLGAGGEEAELGGHGTAALSRRRAARPTAPLGCGTTPLYLDDCSFPPEPTAAPTVTLPAAAPAPPESASDPGSAASKTALAPLPMRSSGAACAAAAANALSLSVDTPPPLLVVVSSARQLVLSISVA